MNDLTTIVRNLIVPFAETINNLLSNFLYNTPEVFGLRLGAWAFLLFGLSIIFGGIFDRD